MIRTSSFLLLHASGLKRILLEQSYNVLHEKIIILNNRLLYMTIKTEIKKMENSLEKERK